MFPCLVLSRLYQRDGNSPLYRRNGNAYLAHRETKSNVSRPTREINSTHPHGTQSRVPEDLCRGKDPIRDQNIMANATPGRRWSILHLLSHEQQLQVFRLHTQISGLIWPRPRPRLDDLPPELRLMIFEACIEQHTTERQLLESDYGKQPKWVGLIMSPELFRRLDWLIEKTVVGIRITAGLAGVLANLKFAEWSGSVHLLGVVGCLLLWWRKGVLLRLKRARDGISRLRDPDRPIPPTTLGHEVLGVAILGLGFVMALPKMIWQIETEDGTSSVKDNGLGPRKEWFGGVYQLPIFLLNKQLRGEAIGAAWRALQKAGYYDERTCRWRWTRRRQGESR